MGEQKRDNVAEAKQRWLSARTHEESEKARQEYLSLLFKAHPVPRAHESEQKRLDAGRE